MFDHYSREDHHHTHSSTITEKRAPTDESVRLLKDFESEARKKIEESIRLEDNGFECVAHVSQDFLNCQLIVIVLFKLNGKQHRSETRLNSYGTKSIEEIISAIRDDVAKKIAAQIFSAFDRGMQNMISKYAGK